jgi:hypothetical protein
MSPARATNELIDQKKALRPDERSDALEYVSTGVSTFECITPLPRRQSILDYGVWTGNLLFESAVYRITSTNSLTLKNEFPLNRIVVLQIDVLRQGRIIHFELRSLRHIGGRAWDSRKYGIPERRHFARGTTERFHLTVGDAPDPQSSFAFPDLERDGRALNRDHLPN